MKIDRSRLFPQIVEQTFNESWPGFKELDADDRRHLTTLLCSAFKCGKYAHTVYQDSISYYCRARDKHFGRGRFFELNDKLNLFVIEGWYQVGSHTKGYRLTREALFLLESLPLRTTELIDFNGLTVKTPAKDAILQRDANGNNRKGKGQLSAVVPVHIDNMVALLAEARAWKHHFNDGCAPPQGGRFEQRLLDMADDKQRLDWLTSYLITPLTLTILRADTAVLPRGHLEIQYLESAAGRLYAVAGVMQTMPREVRSAAFAGCYDYDVESCHFDILRQLAERIGIETPAITDYILRKSEIRREIAADIDAPVKAVKAALIAIIYGASKRLNGYYKQGREVQPAIVRLMGVDKAAELFAHPLYLALHREVKTVRKPILEAAPRNRKKIVNAFGKGLSEDETPEARLAHIVQGAEALILDTVIQAHSRTLRLLMHDGWVTSERLDVAELSKLIFQATGFWVALAENEIS
jgi:hypothetical protein